jgi:integrase
MTIAASLADDGSSFVEKDTKSHRARAVALDPATTDVLRTHQRNAAELADACESPLDGDRFVFSPRPGNDQPYIPKVLTRRFARLCEREKIKGIRLHDLRHFAGSQLVASGVDVLTVSRRLGHSRPSITLDIYSHQVAEHDRAAASVLGAIVTGRR